MESEKYRMYQDILTRYKDCCYGKEHDRKQFLHDFGEYLHDPEFLKMLREDEECRKATAYLTRPTIDDIHVKPFVDALRDFAGGTSVEFSDIELQVLETLYQKIPEFRSLCDDDPAMHDAISYWLEELQRRASKDERFKIREFIMKLRLFHTDPSIEFSDTDLDMLAYAYHNNAEFQKTCTEEVVVSKALTYWLEERERRIPKKEDTTL